MTIIAEALTAMFTQVGTDMRNLRLMTDAFRNIREELLTFQRLSKDENDVYTETQYFREDGTLFRLHTLSGGTSPNYTNLSIKFYDAAGVEVIFEWKYLITYDADGNVLAKAFDEYIDYSLLPDVATLTGGTVIDQGGYRIHIFTTSGTLEVASAEAVVDRLMVAGGGGGGSVGVQNGGAGGAGGMIVETGITLSVGTYSIVIGAGGLGNTISGYGGYNGGNTTMTGATDAIGGGGGGDSVGSPQLPDSARNGKSGGSGGGAGGDHWYQPRTVGGAGTPGQGYAGADSYSNGTFPGPGGGAGGPGTFANNDTGRGPSVNNAFSGTDTAYCRGGATGSENYPNGTANTGEGGSCNGRNGGSGIVVIRYPLPV